MANDLIKGFQTGYGIYRDVQDMKLHREVQEAKRAKADRDARLEAVRGHMDVLEFKRKQVADAATQAYYADQMALKKREMYNAQTMRDVDAEYKRAQIAGMGGGVEGDAPIGEFIRDLGDGTKVKWKGPVTENIINSQLNSERDPYISPQQGNIAYIDKQILKHEAEQEKGDPYAGIWGFGKDRSLEIQRLKKKRIELEAKDKKENEKLARESGLKIEEERQIGLITDEEAQKRAAIIKQYYHLR